MKYEGWVWPISYGNLVLNLNFFMSDQFWNSFDFSVTFQAISKFPDISRFPGFPKKWEPCKKSKSKVYYLIPRKCSTVWRSILMRLYSPVDLTGDVNMIEKLVLGGTGTGDLPILSPTR